MLLQKALASYYGKDNHGMNVYEVMADYILAHGNELATDINDGCKWIPVTERTPIKEFEEAKAGGQNVYSCLAVVKLYGYNTPYIIKVWHDGLGFIDNNSIDISASVTHWMPLPKLPKDGE